MKKRIAALASIALFGLAACADNSPSAVVERTMDDMSEGQAEMFCENYAEVWDELVVEIEEEFEEEGGDDWDAEEARQAFDDYCDDL